MSNKKYCLHPGKLKVKVAGRDENGEANGKPEWAMKYFSAQDVATSYGVKIEECVVWGRGVKASDFIHLHPDPKGRYVIEERAVLDKEPKSIRQKNSKHRAKS